MRSAYLLLGILFSLPGISAVSAAEDKPIQAVNAADWKPTAEDASAALQGAIDSGAGIVRVPNIGRPWVVTPITLRGDLELIFEDGVEVEAKKGGFLGKLDCLFKATDARNLVIRGEGTVVLRMHKRHYQMAAYKKSEWRHGISLLGCENVRVENLTVRETGGDGIYLSRSNTLNGCRHVVIRNVISDANHRQGLSVIAGSDLLIENCVFKNTEGAAPEAGFDIEPNGDGQSAERITVRNCLSENNGGAGFITYFLKLSAEKSPPLDITFENCRVVNNKGAAFVVGAVGDNNPSGTIRFLGCTAENTQGPGIYLYDKSRNRARIRFENCTLKNVAQSNRGPIVSPELVGKDVDDAVPNAPVVLFLRRPQITKTPGGVDFVDCVVEDRGDRPVVVAATLTTPHHPVGDLSGTIKVSHPNPVMNLGADATAITLKLVETK